LLLIYDLAAYALDFKNALLCIVLLLFVDLGRKAALIHFLLLLFLERLPYLELLFVGLLLNSSLLLIDIDHDLILHIVLVHVHVLLGDEQVCALFLVELFYQFVVSLIKVLRLLNCVQLRHARRWLVFEVLRVFLLRLNGIFLCIDKVLLRVEFLLHLHKGLRVHRCRRAQAWVHSVALVLCLHPAKISMLIDIAEIVIFKVIILHVVTRSRIWFKPVLL
jgi:hypothetical protein